MIPASTRPAAVRRVSPWPLALVGLALCVAGCASAASNRVDVVPQGTASIEVANSGLQGECEIVSGRALYEDETLMGIVELRSHEDEKQTLEYRWSWFDADGVRQGNESDRPWKTVFVNALEEKQVVGKAMRKGATRGQMELRYHSGVTDADN